MDMKYHNYPTTTLNRTYSLKGYCDSNAAHNLFVGINITCVLRKSTRKKSEKKEKVCNYRNCGEFLIQRSLTGQIWQISIIINKNKICKYLLKIFLSQ